MEKDYVNHSAHNKLVSFIWSIADDCLGDVYVRGKYRDVTLPMVALRRLDTPLEPSKDKIGYEVSFNKYFHRHEPLRGMDDVKEAKSE